MRDTFSHSTLSDAPAEKLLVDTREAARLLSISERTLWTLTNQGAIKCIRVGRAVRYSLSSLETFAEGKS